MNKKLACCLLFALTAVANAQDASQTATQPAPAPMVEPAPMPAPAPAPVAQPAPAPVAQPAPAPVAQPAPAPAVEQAASQSVVKSTSFTAEKIKPGKLNLSAKADKGRPAKAENRERWRASRIERAERNHEINRNEGRRLRIQALRLNKLEVKKEQGAALSAEALSLLDSMLAADLDLQYYPAQDKLWTPVSRELNRLDNRSEKEPEPAKKAKYQQAEERVPSLK